MEKKTEVAYLAQALSFVVGLAYTLASLKRRESGDQMGQDGR